MKTRFLLTLSSILLFCFFSADFRLLGAENRIISLVPSQTELLFALGLGTQLVGVSDYCNYPPEALEKPKIGGLELNIERIMSLRPSILVDINNMHKKYEMLFGQLGLNYVNFNLTRLEQLPQVALELAEILSAQEKGVEFATSWNKQIENLELEAPANQVKVYFEIWDTPMQAAGSNSYIGEMLSKAGGSNIFSDTIDFPVVNSEAIINGDPDVIFVAYPLPKLETIKNRAGWQSMKAIKKNQIYALDQDLFIRPGPRNLAGLKQLNSIFRQVYSK